MQHWMVLAVVVAVSYWLGAKYPGLLSKIGM